MRRHPSLLALGALMLSACGLGQRAVPGDDAPTLASLAKRPLPVVAQGGPPYDETRAIAAYEAYLATTTAGPRPGPSAVQVRPEAAPRAEPRTALRGESPAALRDGSPAALRGESPAPLRGESPTALRAVAQRRLADLEMDLADRRAVDGEAPNYDAAVARYRRYLDEHPGDPGNDRVLYQLARAQEQAGQLDAALATLDRLVARFPATAHRDEAEFRRGELLFGARRYAAAESAFAAVLRAGAGNPLLDRALYMQGWSRYKQGHLDAALEAFLSVLDLRLGPGTSDDERPLDQLPNLARADRELLEDTLRVVSLSLDGLQGAASLPGHVQGPRRAAYQHRIYWHLGEHFLRQGRARDAADTFARFAQMQPDSAMAALARARVIAIFQDAGFDGQALAAKKDFVLAYAPRSASRTAQPAAWARAQPDVRLHLATLARHHHAQAQASRAAAAVDEAERWYRLGLESMADSADAAAERFMLAELLSESGRHEQAVEEYERSAYAMPRHPRSADAGYAALLALRAQGESAEPAQRATLRGRQVDSAMRFVEGFPSDPRRAEVLADAADTLFALRRIDASTALSRQLLELQPAATAAQRRVAWSVLGHAAFDRQDFVAAEAAYREVLATMDRDDPARAGSSERLAASIYRQAEAERDAGHAAAAVVHFRRVDDAAPLSAVAPAALFDAATALITQREWADAARTLETLRQRHPRHALAGEVAPKLALVYGELSRWADAGREFEAMAARLDDAELARAARWQAAAAYDRAGASGAAATAYVRYVQQHAEPLQAAVEARWRLAELAREAARTKDEQTWLQAVRQADATGGEQRSARTRTLGALAALRLAEAPALAYRQVALVEPLARSLKLKKARFDAVLQAYAQAATGSPEGAAAATFHTAELYRDFGQAVLASQRPRRLGKAELEQYQVMLEEQAFPFEEKAVELHAGNTRLTAQGLYDEWVRRSYAALREMRPLRYAKPERPTVGEADTAGGWNALAIAHREAGRFDEAEAAYRRALAIDASLASAHLNLGILYDLYLHDNTRALAQYDAYLKLAGGDATVSKWLADLRLREARPSLAVNSVKAKP